MIWNLCVSMKVSTPVVVVVEGVVVVVGVHSCIPAVGATSAIVIVVVVAISQHGFCCRWCHCCRCKSCYRCWS